MDTETLEKWITGYASSLREGHKLAAESEAQSDQLLTWIVGLMGAGIFAAPTFLSSLRISLANRRTIIGVLSPWVLGVLVGVVGRLLALELKEANDAYSAAKIQDIETLRFQSTNMDTLLQRFISIAKDAGDHGKRLKKAECLQRWTRRFYYAAYVLLGFGMISVVLFAFLM